MAMERGVLVGVGGATFPKKLLQARPLLLPVSSAATKLPSMAACGATRRGDPETRLVTPRNRTLDLIQGKLKNQMLRYWEAFSMLNFRNSKNKSSISKEPLAPTELARKKGCKISDDMFE